MLEERLKATGIYPLCFRLRAEEDLRLPEYKGALFRGGFGAFFRAAVCSTGAERCAGCGEIATCPYSLVFETPVAPERFPLLRKYPHAPHPFVMTPPVDSRREIRRGEEFLLEVTLIGPGVEHLPHFIGAIAAMGRGGQYGGRFRIARVEYASGLVFDGKTGRLEGKPVAWSPGERVRARRATLHFVTPLSLRWKGEYQRAPDFRAVAHGLLGRIHLLSALYGGCPAGREWLRPLLACVDGLRTEARFFRPYQWSRTRGRTGERVPVRGVLGTLTVAGELAPVAAALEAGQYLLVGSGTSMGMGKYRVQFEGGGRWDKTS